MKTTIKTLQYIWKRFFYLFPFVFIPAFVISILPTTASNFVVFDYLQNQFISAKHANFNDIYLGITKNSKIEMLYLLIVILTLVPLFIATVTGLIQRDMRIGSFSYKAAFKQLNRSFVQTFLFIVILIIIVQIYLLFISIFCYLLKLFLFEHPRLLMTLAIIVILLLTIAIVIVCSILSIAVPDTIYTGRNYIDSMSCVILKSKGHRLDMIVSALIPTIFSYVVLYLTSYLANKYLRVFISTIVVLINMLIMVTIMNVVFFDINNLERKDLENKKIKIRKI